MGNWKRTLQDGLLTLLILAAVFVLVLILQRFFAVDRLIPMLFVLGVFLVSLQTEGYMWGVIASLLGVLLVNYAFMFPYYAIDLLTPVNMATAVVMLIVSVMTSTLEVNEMMGSELHLHVYTEDGTRMIVRVPTIGLSMEQRNELVYGKKLYITFEGKVMHFFGKKSGLNLIYG